MGNIGCLINIAVLATYLIFAEDRSYWVGTFRLWTWLPFLVFLYFTNFFDGMQNTTRNIARIYLLKTRGIGYAKSLAKEVQALLIPNTLFLPTVLWQLAGVASFATLLFLQGWLVAVAAHGIHVVAGGFLPLSYQSHLRRIRDYLENSLDPAEAFPLVARGISLSGLLELVDTAIQQKRNPQDWWGECLREAAAEAVVVEAGPTQG